MRIRSLFMLLLLISIISVSVSVSPAPAADTQAYGAPAPATPWLPGQLPPEKQRAFDSLYREHREAVFSLQEQIWAKKTLLHALSGNPKAEPQQLATLVDELAGLRKSLHAERRTFAEKARQEFDADVPARGLPMPMGGYGPCGDRRGCGDGSSFTYVGDRKHAYRAYRGHGHKGGYRFMNEYGNRDDLW